MRVRNGPGSGVLIVGRRTDGFSLTELLIAVMILGIGMVMIAGAFPVGLASHSESVDRTMAGMLARTAISRLTVLRTQNGSGDFSGSDSVLYDFWPQVSVAECFSTPAAGAAEQVAYLFDRSGGGPTHNKTTAGGRILSQAGLGDDIDAWLPRSERVAAADPRLGYHVFYRLMNDPGGTDRERTYVVYVVVQRTPSGAESGSFDERFPPPSAPLSVAEVDGAELQLDDGYAAQAGALVVDCGTGDWCRVASVAGKTLTLTQPPRAGIEGRKVRIVNHAVVVLAGVVNKQHVP